MRLESLDGVRPADPDSVCVAHGRWLHGFVHEVGYAVVASFIDVFYAAALFPKVLGDVHPGFGHQIGGQLDIVTVPGGPGDERLGQGLGVLAAGGKGSGAAASWSRAAGGARASAR